MKNLVLILFLFGITAPVFSQIIQLDEVFIYPVKYKYLFEVVDADSDANVKKLEIEIAKFDVTKQEYYSDEYDGYNVSFYIPEGYAVAAYDKEGNILRTIERYKNVKLPILVSRALVKRFPRWKLEKDIYKVNYNESTWDAKKIYKLRLTNGDKTIRVKTDEKGNFL
jgi:hypothetical protein